MIDIKKFRIVHFPEYGLIEDPSNPSNFFLQLPSMFGWRFAIGADRGAPGYYNYQFENACNAYYFISHGIPDHIKERNKPTLSKFRKKIAFVRSLCEIHPTGKTFILDIPAAEDLLAEWSARKDFSIVNPYPHNTPEYQNIEEIERQKTMELWEKSRLKNNKFRFLKGL
jgi:hypothetical protein